MAGRKFLNPLLKSVLCAAGMVILGYFLYPSLLAGTTEDSTTLLRLLVFLAFAYLFVQSVRELLGRPGG
jgi:hypothetical protein